MLHLSLCLYVSALLPNRDIQVLNISQKSIRNKTQKNSAYFFFYNENSF